MYRNRNVPATVEIDGVMVDVDDILRHHEEPEWDDIQRRLDRLDREPTMKERKDIYLAAHATAGTPSERAYVQSLGIDWSAWSAWCRGQEAKVERGPFINEPTDADVKPIPHEHGELAVADEFNENQPRDEHGRWTSGETGYVVAERDQEGKIRIYGIHKDQDFAAQLAAQRKSDNEDEDSYTANSGAHVSVHRAEISGHSKGDLYVVATDRVGAGDDESNVQIHGVYADRDAAKRSQDETLRQRWEGGEGRELDWDHPIMEREWDKQVATWNAAHPDKAIGDRYTFGTYPEFEAPMREKMDGVIEPYPGAKAANDYFSEDGTHTQIIRVRTGKAKVSDAAQHHVHHIGITDANDPTGTDALRKRFMRASDKRWQHAIRIVREAVGPGDMLGLASPNLSSIALRAKHGGVAGADKTGGFHAWLESVLRDVVLGHDGSWMTPFIAEAERSAAERSRQIGARSAPPDHEFHPHRSVAISELRGITSSAVQQGTRAAAAALMHRQKPLVAARTILQALDGAMKRSRLMADYLVSKAFTMSTVAHFRASGIGRVGIVPERYGAKEHGGLVRERMRDAKKRKRKRKRKVNLEFVQVLTAGDDAVCFPAGTLVRTGRGDVAIEDVVETDFALTRRGLRPVTRLYRTQWQGDLIRIETEDGSSFECTPNHPVWCLRGQFIRADQIEPNDVLQTADHKLVNVSGIHKLGFVKSNNGPSDFFKRSLLSVVSILGLRVPVNAIDFNGDAISEIKIDEPFANLGFRHEGDAVPLEDCPHDGFWSRLASIAPVAFSGAKARIGRWHISQRHSALKASEHVGRTAAFFRAIPAVQAASHVAAGMFERFAASLAFLPLMSRVQSFAFQGTEIVPVSSGAFSDDERSVAAAAYLADGIGSVSLIAGSRTELVADCPIKSRWWLDGSAMKAWIARCLSKAFGWHGITVYNIEVDGIHEYYANGILVHNCEECEDASENGPYTLDEASDLVPLHPRCRCALIPAFDARFGSPLD